MKYNLIEKFILLSLDAKKGTFLIDSLSMNYGIAGAILLELSELNKISIQNKKLILIDSKLTDDKIINECIRLISNSKKSHRTKYWIYKIGNKSSVFKKEILLDLQNKNILIFKKKKYFFGIFSSLKYLVINNKSLDETKKRIRDILLYNENAELDDLLLLSLINSCKLTRAFFVDKNNYKIARVKIKELTKNMEISDAVGQTLKEIQAAVLIATTSAFVGASSN